MDEWNAGYQPTNDLTAGGDLREAQVEAREVLAIRALISLLAQIRIV
jgi:hypothetical protein